MELDLKEMLRIMRRRWWLLVIVPLLTCGGAYIVTAQQPPTFQTTATMRVYPTSGGEESLNYNAIVGTQSLVETFRRLIVSRPMLTDVITELNLNNDVIDLERRVSSRSIQGTQLFEVTVMDRNPEVAARIADTLAKNFRAQVPQSGIAASVVQAAPIPTSPIAPQTTIAALLALAAGLLVAIALVALLEYLDESVRETSDFTALAGVPLLTTIGRFPFTFTRSRGPLVIQASPRSASAEAIGVLRANVELAIRSQGTRTIVVCSPGEDEGRSMVAANLSVALAQAGLSTVLVDANLRHPSLHTLFSVRNHTGLATLLSDPDERWEAAASDVGMPNLTLIPSGSPTPLPAALLSLNRLRQRMADISRSADVVVVDTPPFLALSDAFVVATSVDSAILVCNSGETRAHALKATATTLSHSGVRLLGVVLNRPIPSWHPRQWLNAFAALRQPAELEGVGPEATTEYAQPPQGATSVSPAQTTNGSSSEMKWAYAWPQLTEPHDKGGSGRASS